MSRFFLHVRIGGKLVLDPQGIEVATVGEARERALSAIRRIVNDPVTHDLGQNAEQIEIVDETGATVMIVRYSDVVPGLMH